MIKILITIEDQGDGTMNTELRGEVEGTPSLAEYLVGGKLKDELDLFLQKFTQDAIGPTSSIRKDVSDDESNLSPTED